MQVFVFPADLLGVVAKMTSIILTESLKLTEFEFSNFIIFIAALRTVKESVSECWDQAVRDFCSMPGFRHNFN
jgi:hypothetical protein